MAADPRVIEQMRSRIGQSLFVKWFGIELEHIGDGESRLRLEPQPHHLNPGGIAHGGVIATLVDACIGMALRSRLGADDAHVTVHMDVQYLGMAVPGEPVFAEGKAVQSGQRIGYGEAELKTSSGRLVARGSATFLVLPGAAGSRRDGSLG